MTTTRKLRVAALALALAVVAAACADGGGDGAGPGGRRAATARDLFTRRPERRAARSEPVPATASGLCIETPEQPP